MRNLSRNLIGKPDETRPAGGTWENNGKYLKGISRCELFK
jgi:hypothetical protein